MKRIGSLFTDTVRLHHKFHRKVFHDYNLHRGQHRVLHILFREEVMKQVELAKRLDITAATLTRMVQSMERNGFLTRYKDEKDQRVTLLKLTELGKNTHIEIDKILEKRDREIFKDFTTQEKEVFINLLYKIQNSIEVGSNIENNN